VRFRIDQEGLGVDAEPLAPHLDLAGRLLARHVEDPLRRLGKPGQDLQQQGGLADPGIAADQDHGALDDPAAENPVELPDTGQEPRFHRIQSRSEEVVWTALPRRGDAPSRPRGSAPPAYCSRTCTPESVATG